MTKVRVMKRKFKFMVDGASTCQHLHLNLAALLRPSRNGVSSFLSPWRGLLRSTRVYSAKGRTCGSSHLTSVRTYKTACMHSFRANNEAISQFQIRCECPPTRSKDLSGLCWCKMKSESGFNFAMFVIQLKNEFRFWNIDMGSSLKKEFHNASCKNGVRKRERL